MEGVNIEIRKRITAILCAAAMVFVLNACSKTVYYSGQTITGQVTSIDGNKITLQLGEISEQEMDMPDRNGENPPNHIKW